MPRPDPPTLADVVYRDTFHKAHANTQTMQQLRAKMFAARRFVLDERMSGFLADLASAAFVSSSTKGRPGRQEFPHAPSARVGMRRKVAEQLRISSRLPHRITWIEYDLFKLTQRNYELGYTYDKAPPRRNEIPDVEGWLIEQHHQDEGAFRCIIFTWMKSMADAGRSGVTAWMFPWVYMWTVHDGKLPYQHMDPNTQLFNYHSKPSDELIPATPCSVATGLVGYNSHQVGIVPIAVDESVKASVGMDMITLLREWHGVLRRVWALLATLNDIPVALHEVRASKGFVGRGSYHRFLDHKTITLTVPMKKDLAVVARSVVAAARRRAHMVRAHWRKDWRHPPSPLCEHEWDVENICKTCKGHRLWIHEHERGDASLGVVMTDYKVEHPA